MFEWPRFAAHLNLARSPEERLGALLAALAAPVSMPRVQDVLAALFEDDALVDAVQRLAPRVHHVGFVAPPALEAAAIEAVLRESPFRDQLHKFKSAALVRELSSRLGRDVNVMIVRARSAAHPARSPAVEIFIADLPAAEIETLVVQETGCHVALALDSNWALARVREVLHTHGCWEIPLMRNGPVVNHEIQSSVLYVDVPNHGRTRRVEFLTADALEA